MANGFSTFPQRELQKLVGDSLLSRLEQILPVLTQNFDNTDIYRRESLAGIFDAFSAGKLIRNAEFRSKLLNYQSPKVIEELCNNLGINKDALTFQERVDELLKLGWRKRETCEVMVSVLGLSRDHIPETRQQELGEDLISPVSPPFKSLKDYQIGVYQQAIARLNVPRSRFIVQMPTGSGKTRTAMEIVSEFLNNNEGQSKNVLWLAHVGELCEQAAIAFNDVWMHIGKRPVLLSKAWGSIKFNPAKTEHPVMLVAGFQKLVPLVSGKQTPELKKFLDSFGLIVVDEAHTSIAPTFQDVIQSFLNPNTKVVGLTATPGRSTVSASQNKKLSEFFFQEIVGIPHSERGVINDLQQRRVLARAYYEPLVTNRKYKLSSKQQEYLSNFFDIPPGLLKKIGDDDIRNVEIIKKLISELDQKRKIIFFACSVEQSKFISSIIQYSGYKSAHVDGAVAPARRSNLIQSFRSGDIQVLCNYGVLSTGFDVPEIDVVFIARPTASVVLYSQMIGRGLRGPEIGGTETCKIIDVRDNIDGYSNPEHVYNYFEDYWHDH